MDPVESGVKRNEALMRAVSEIGMRLLPPHDCAEEFKSHREVVGRHARAKKQIEFAHEYVPFDLAPGPHNQCSPGVTYRPDVLGQWKERTPCPCSDW
jgi:hypothetical protein